MTRGPWEPSQEVFGPWRQCCRMAGHNSDLLRPVLPSHDELELMSYSSAFRHQEIDARTHWCASVVASVPDRRLVTGLELSTRNRLHDPTRDVVELYRRGADFGCKLTGHAEGDLELSTSIGE